MTECTIPEALNALLPAIGVGASVLGNILLICVVGVLLYHLITRKQFVPGNIIVNRDEPLEIVGSIDWKRIAVWLIATGVLIAVLKIAGVI